MQWSFDPKTLVKCLKNLEIQEDFSICIQIFLNGKTDDDTFLTFSGNKIFTAIGNIFF